MEPLTGLGALAIGEGLGTDAVDDGGGAGLGMTGDVDPAGGGVLLRTARVVDTGGLEGDGTVLGWERASVGETGLALTDEKDAEVEFTCCFFPADAPSVGGGGGLAGVGLLEPGGAELGVVLTGGDGLASVGLLVRSCGDVLTVLTLDAGLDCCVWARVIPGLLPPARAGSCADFSSEFTERCDAWILCRAFCLASSRCCSLLKFAVSVIRASWLVCGCFTATFVRCPMGKPPALWAFAVSLGVMEARKASASNSLSRSSSLMTWKIHEVQSNRRKFDTSS